MSITNLREYGDLDKIKEDAKILQDIISRQGMKFLIDVMANHVGDNAIRFEYTTKETQNVVTSLIDDFKNALNERT